MVRACYETGNEALLNPLLADLRPQLVSYLKTKGIQDAELRADLIQDAMTHALNEFRQRKFAVGTGAVGAWAKTICWHRFGNYKARKTNHISQPWEDEDPFLLLAETMTIQPDEPVTPEEAARPLALVRNATDAVLQLEAAPRAAVTLHYCQGMPVKEAAQQLGITWQTFRVHLRQGLAQLQRWASTQARPTADTYAALRGLDTDDLFTDYGLRPAA